jgi:aminoglycoside 6'-N-acetyltransferase
MFTFKKVTVGDFPLMYHWLQLPHVKKYWYANDHFTFEETCEKYSRRLLDDKHHMYIIQCDLVDIGYIQSYQIENTLPFMVDEMMIGIDLYIGDIDYYHKNYGKDILKTFIEDYVFKDKLIRYVGIDPEIDNQDAIKAYKKAGFYHVNTEFSNEMKKMTYYMILERTKIYL